MPEEVRPAPGRLHEDDLPARARQLEHEPRRACARSDVEQWTSGLRHDRQPEKGVDHQVTQPGPGVAIAGQPARLAPPLKLSQVGPGASHEGLR